MSEPRTVLDHLIDSRDALVLEVRALASAIDELDSVIVRLGGEASRPTPASFGSLGAPAEADGVVRAEVVGGTEPSVPEDVNPAVPTVPAAAASRRSAARPARKIAEAAQSAQSAQPQKSIRVHVLEMLASENREFGLAEIIDRIHDAGIQAHDDAVRSITIKLMKDGKIERPSRGSYRLSRRGGQASPAAPAPAAGAEPAATPEAANADGAGRPPADAGPPAPADYTPPLNLGQPWDRRS